VVEQQRQLPPLLLLPSNLADRPPCHDLFIRVVVSPRRKLTPLPVSRKYE